MTSFGQIIFIVYEEFRNWCGKNKTKLFRTTVINTNLKLIFCYG